MKYKEDIMYVLRVFVDKNGNYGNPVGVIFDEKNILSNEERQIITTNTGFSEVVFVNHFENYEVSIFNPIHEIKFAGHAMIGISWLLSNLRSQPIKSMKCLGGEIITWQAGEETWIKVKLDMIPPWNYEELSNANEVEEIKLVDTSSKEHIFVWAWIDKNKGLVRARTFAPDWNIPEDEANGSGSMKLASQLGKEIKIIHGKGSVIYAKPSVNNNVEVGGLVKLVEERSIYS